ncbi:MAG: DNA-directed DNA polymerase I [Promethearchaeota archaeon]
MPPSKKKKQDDKSQTSLFSFVDNTDTKKKKTTELKKESNIEKTVEKKPTDKPKAKKEEKDKEKTPKFEASSEGIPSHLFFQGNDEDFGLKEGNIKLPNVLRENFSSKYIRYLIEKGEIIENMERGILLDVDYDGGQNKAYCKFYDLENDEIKIWIDTTNHEPYCISKETIVDLQNIIELTDYEGFTRFEEIKKTDLLKDKEISMTKIYGKTPSDIGGSGTNIRNILGKNNKKAWEADIRYHLNYIFDRQLIPGLIYSIKDGQINKLSFEEDSEESKNMANELRDQFKNESSELQEFSEKFLDIFLTPIPDVKRLAMDIEVNMGSEDFIIPDPRQAKQAIISISFVASDGLKLVYVLKREGFLFHGLHKKFPSDAKLIFFKSEKRLLIETFRLLWEYPIIITFNGDNFDLNYMFHRANKLKIDKDLNPIHIKRGFGFLSRSDCDLRKGIHIDLFNFFFNRSISGYAFGGAYESSSLNAISDALLGKMKYEHEEEIHEMEYDVLTWYNLKDSILTLELTQFNNSLVWNLIILLCRITKMPIHETVRRQISTWIQNIFYFEHRRKNYLIPRRSEIAELKTGGYSKAVIEGKTFAGAYVVPPVPGIHFDVVVMDFASLYPSIIKEYNLSYETVLCPHKDDEDNLVKGTPYHICTKKMGIFAYVVGFFRDIRVKYFKPKSSDKSLTEKKRSYYHTIQQALKVFINGSYGVFGSQNFPLFCLPVAESTTSIGQYSIKQTIKKSEDIGVKVLYGDTDSVFLLNPTSDQMKIISEWSKSELDLDLEEEKAYQFLALSERKKNYIGIYKDTKYVDIKGLVAKKKNTPDFIKKAFSEMIEILKQITNNDEFLKAKDKIKEIVRNNLKKIGKPDAFILEDYVINIGLQKDLKSYTKVIPQHVRAALELKEVTGKEFQKGETISFIKSKGPIGAKAIELAKLQDIDTKKYKDLLISALEQVLDALGITYEEIKGIKKMDAFF